MNRHRTGPPAVLRAGHGGLLSKAAYADIITWNGSEAFNPPLAGKIQLGTAPEGPLRRGVGLYCLSGSLMFAGLGAFDYLSRIYDAFFERRPPWPYNYVGGWPLRIPASDS